VETGRRDVRLVRARVESANCIVAVCDTLRRDHCGPYHGGAPLCDVRSDEQLDRLGIRDRLSTAG